MQLTLASRGLIVALALAVAPWAAAGAQYDRPILPRRNLKVRVEPDTAARETIHRLRMMRLEGSRMGSADVGLEVVRLDRPYDIVEYHLVLDVVDTASVRFRVGEDLEIRLADEVITIATAGNVEGAWDVNSGSQARLPNDRRPHHIYHRQVVYFPITPAEMISIALASEATLVIHTERRTYTRFLRGKHHDEFRAFVVHYVDGAPIPVNQPPG